MKLKLMREKKSIIELTRVTEEEYLASEKEPLILLADNVRSMQNIGSMLRTSDAFGVKEMVMAGISAVPPHAEISKTALGAERSVRWRHVEDSYEEVKRLKGEGCKIAVLEQAHDSIAPEEFKRESPTEVWVLVVGNEVDGVDQRIVDIADVVIEIPMRGVKHSLNVAVSTGIALYALMESNSTFACKSLPS